MAFCTDCAHWRYEENPALRNPDEQDGFGECEKVAAMSANPTRALARVNDDFARFQTRRDFGCTLHEAR